MSGEKMYEMLNLCIDTRDGEVVNFKGLRILLNGVMYCAEREVEGAREADGDRDVSESMSLRLSAKHRQEDRETECMSVMQDLKKENKELKKETYKLKKEVKTLKNQLSQCLTQEDLQTALDIERQKIIKELKKNVTDTGHIYTSTEISVTQTSRDNFTAESDKALPQLADPTMSLVSTGGEHYSETLEALKDISELLYEKNKSLESRIERLEGERERLMDQVNQLEAQLVMATMADSEKKADMQALETKVIKSNSTTLMLHRMCQDLSKKITDHEVDCQQFAEKIFRELDSKVNHSELDPLQKQLDCQMSFPKQVVAESAQNDDAAGLNKQFNTMFSSLSDDSSDDIKTPGPPTLAILPKPPGFPPSKQQSNFHRRLKSFRDRDGYSFEKHIYKDHQDTSDVKNIENSLPTIYPKKGNCKNKDMVNHNQLLTSCQRKSIQLPPLLPQISNRFRSTENCKNKDMVNHNQSTSHQRKSVRLLPLRPQISNTFSSTSSSSFKKDKLSSKDSSS